MTYMDIKPKVNTELGLWQRRLEHAQSLQLIRKGKKIEVTFVDGDAVKCSGYGKRLCDRNGQHNWFNHNMDLYMSSGAKDNGSSDQSLMTEVEA